MEKNEEAFFQKCDPGMRSLHLYGGTDRSWEVKPPTLKLRAPTPPEPTLDISIWRDTME
ncbi:unnamed protein product [Miscanthus lutarioriparius]|uniref:PHD finger protein ALFIN-LIKE n=1 Tax=Miscanthus lutarioriparius TaxID=422564 RepID=A0A811RVL3_9POAL|nr:unnamed protein product [Miscanthus lutarioriparius]